MFRKRWAKRIVLRSFRMRRFSLKAIVVEVRPSLRRTVINIAIIHGSAKWMDLRGKSRWARTKAEKSLALSPGRKYIIGVPG